MYLAMGHYYFIFFKSHFFFFWIGNEKKIINKETNLSTLAMHYGGIDQEPKLQQSRKTRKMQQSHTPSKEST